LLNLETILPIQRQRLLDDQMLPGFSSRDGMPRVILWVTAYRDDLQRWIGQHLGEIVVRTDLPAMPGADLLRIKWTRRVDRGDLRVRRRINRGNVCAGNPAVSDNSDVILFCNHCPFESQATTSPPQWYVKAKGV